MFGNFVKELVYKPEKCSTNRMERNAMLEKIVKKGVDKKGTP